MLPAHRATFSYRPDIDGLRAVAVLLVVFFHGAFREVPGGYVGVDIFFVISGFLITGIILQELNAGDFSFAAFYARRIKRICPALFAMLALCAAAGYFLLVPEDLRVLGRSIVATVFFYANWHFYTQVGYFDGPAIEKPLLHTWSLAVEEQFYLIWPAALVLLARIVSRRVLPNLILGLACLSLLASQVMLRFDPAQVFYLLPYRAWELLLGGFIAIVPAPSLSKRAATLLGIFGFGGIAYAAVAFDTKTPFPGVNGLFPCVGAGLLILAGMRQNAWSSLVLGAGPLRFVGKISYSLYLIHWPIFSFAHLSLDRAPTLVERLAIIGVSISAAALSWRFVESPARRVKISFPALVGASASAALALGLCGILYHATQGLPLRVSRAVQEADAARKKENADCRRDAAPVPNACAIGAPASGLQYDFVVWGDSHARHLASAFAEQAAQRGLAGIIMWSASCGPFIDDLRVPRHCMEYNKQFERWARTQTKLRTVFLAGYWRTYAGGPLAVPEYDEVAGVLAKPRSNAGQAGMAGTLRLLRLLQVQAVIVEDVPQFPFTAGLCAARARMFGRADDGCFTLPKSQFEQKEQLASAILREISRNFSIPLVQTAEAFCEGDMCRSEKDGVIFYRDVHHLNIAGAKYLGSKVHIPWPGLEPRGGDTADLAKLAN
jgi:peptidoglycan/LPS O-acetylase OafA/YrhL